MDIEHLWEALRPNVVTKYGTERADHIAQLLTAMNELHVRNLDVYLSKLERAPLGSDEFSATLREGVYARDFASRSNVVVAIEAHGGRGPDLGVAVGGVPVNVELKRLTGGSRSHAESLEDWYLDEIDPEARPCSRGWEMCSSRRAKRSPWTAAAGPSTKATALRNRRPRIQDPGRPRDSHRHHRDPQRRDDYRRRQPRHGAARLTLEVPPCAADRPDGVRAIAAPFEDAATAARPQRRARRVPEALAA